MTPGRPRGSLLWLSSIALLLAGCAGDINTPGEPLRIFGAEFETAFLGEPYNEPILVVGGLRPFSFELTEGELPPGLSLQGGSVLGTPTTIGSYSFTITVSDANLSKTFQSFSLQVAERPPVEITFNPPPTQVQRPITLRVALRGARDLIALRTLVSWDPELFDLVPESVSVARANFVAFEQAAAGELQIDFASLAEPLSGDPRILTFQLAPKRPAFLELAAATEFLSAGERHDFQRTREGVPEPGTEEADEEAPADGGEQAPPPDGDAPPGGDG